MRIYLESWIENVYVMRSFVILFDFPFLFIRFADKQNRIEEDCWLFVQFACHFPMFTYSVWINFLLSSSKRTKRNNTMTPDEYLIEWQLFRPQQLSNYKSKTTTKNIFSSFTFILAIVVFEQMFNVYIPFNRLISH